MIKNNLVIDEEKVIKHATTKTLVYELKRRDFNNSEIKRLNNLKMSAIVNTLLLFTVFSISIWLISPVFALWILPALFMTWSMAIMEHLKVFILKIARK